jgi:hypothetical protein
MGKLTSLMSSRSPNLDYVLMKPCLQGAHNSILEGGHAVTLLHADTNSKPWVDSELVRKFTIERMTPDELRGVDIVQVQLNFTAAFREIDQLEDMKCREKQAPKLLQAYAKLQQRLLEDNPRFNLLHSSIDVREEFENARKAAQKIQSPADIAKGEARKRAELESLIQERREERERQDGQKRGRTGHTCTSCCHNDSDLGDRVAMGLGCAVLFCCFACPALGRLCGEKEALTDL